MFQTHPNSDPCTPLPRHNYIPNTSTPTLYSCKDWLAEIFNWAPIKSSHLVSKFQKDYVFPGIVYKMLYMCAFLLVEDE